MIFTETQLKDAYVLELEKRIDQRGFFARTFCENEFNEQGILFSPVQANISFNKHNHTLRGMHYQAFPFQEDKLVRCVKGCIYDVIIDIRPNSETLSKWFAVELSERNMKMLFIPKGFAHGFLTLEAETEVCYLMSEFYHPGAGKGFRWDDPSFAIEWPEDVEMISDKDKQWPLYNGRD